ncbi:hypothetical protein [uncultured Methanobrevibacter sp.]|uniref:hypothetical protein n=1 Tax=uncultured Methanobrevibacter sp. TaxID=253161 RepID=UPI0025F3CB07|nr:hypothetical protein [uncultured Methanobrevibacter sp.]
MNESKLEQDPVVKRLNIMEIDNEFKIINPIDLYGFIDNKKGFVDLINKTKDLIKDFFPDSKLYLEYVEDCEDEELDLVYAYIIDNNDFKESNREKFNLLFKEFIKLHSSYPKAFEFFNIDINSNEEYFKRKLNEL